MKPHVMARIAFTATLTFLGSCSCLPANAGSVSFCDLDKNGTSGASANEQGSQVPIFQDVASLGSIEAEGMGFEPTTPFGAPDFESLNPIHLHFSYPPIACFSRRIQEHVRSGNP